MSGRGVPSQHSEHNAAIEVIRLLRDRGHIAYLAGGCVRDILLDVVPKDYDVATDAKPDEIARCFRRTASVGAAFGVMLVRDYGCTIEVATFRSDGVYSDSRRPDTIEFSSPEKDAQRRDFTINALFMDPLVDQEEPKIIDFVDGMNDVGNKLLRAVGDPKARLDEDHLRALRGVRFAAKYGLTIEDQTFAAIKDHASALSGVSVERIGEEMRKMLLHPSRTKACELIDRLDLDDAIFGDQHTFDAKVMRSLDDDVSYPLALVALAIGRGFAIGDDVALVCSQYRKVLDLSNTDRDSMRAILNGIEILSEQWAMLSVAQKKRFLSQYHANDALAVLGVLNRQQAQLIEQERESLRASPGGLNPPAMVCGVDLIELGLEPGPNFKTVLDSTYDAQLEGRVNTKSDAIAYASQLVKELT